MQQASILLSLGGDSGNTVPKFGVTPAEVVILQAIHGDDSVGEIDIYEDDADRSSQGEMARLNEIYRSARIDDGNGTSRPVVGSLFPGVGVKLPETFASLDINEAFFKAETKGSKAKKAKAKKTNEDDPASDPIPGTIPEAVKTSALD